MKSWAEIGFEIEITADQSPTLRLLHSVDPSKFRGESMHHSGGAWAETLLIYSRVAAEVLQYQPDPEFLIVGLGMGYIELAIAREALLADKPVQRINSFESVPELREFFWRWLHDVPLNPQVSETYETVARHVVSDTNLKIENLKQFLRSHFPKGECLYAELGSEFVLPSRYHGIFYDAFSSKTTPHLWEEDFLARFLNVAAHKECLFTTYACRVSLRQALRRTGFEEIVRPGFQGKRNSTLGRKNWPAKE